MWIVEPTLEYEGFRFCFVCDKFMGSKSEYFVFVNELTGGGVSGWECAHCAPLMRKWLYDPKQELFGFYLQDSAMHGTKGEIFAYPMSEFAQRFPDSVGKILIIHEVDLSMRQENPDFGNTDSWEYLWEVRLPDEAFAAQVAVAYNGKFLTEFEYTSNNHEYGGHGRYESESWREDVNRHGVVAILKDGKHGVIDKNGDFLIPLEFENILIIDKDTAFAQYNGKWGIVSLSGEIPSTTMHTTAELNLRSWRTMDSEVKIVIPLGETVNLLSRTVYDHESDEIEWIWVEYNGVDGFVAKEFLE
jgi:hypothetical protein